MDLGLNNKHAFILGGTGDIGAAIAASLRDEGATVSIHGTKTGEYVCDVRDTDSLKACIEKAIADHGPIDILINSVSAPVDNTTVTKKTWSDFLPHFEIQLKSLVESVALVIDGMKERGGGRIISILTTYVEGHIPAGRVADYIAAKHAVLGLTKSLSKELGKFNITVNGVSPSLIKNNFTDHIPEKMAEMTAYQTPLKRLATNEDIAHAVAFLASDAASYINGANLPVTGGSHL